MGDRVKALATQHAVVIFSKSSCCMCHTMKRFFCDLGVHAVVYELDEEPKGRDMERALIKQLGGSPAVPVVFIGKKLVGRVDTVMSLHLSGSLIPLLRAAGAIWL